MIVEEIKLQQFRNYNNQKARFTKGINMILGKNGAGKTNLVEAIYYLSFARSFRTNDHRDLIMQNKEFACIESLIRIEDQSQMVKMVISNDGQRIQINRRDITKLSELATLINVIVFEPRDVNFFQVSPKIRRSFLNMQLSKLSTKYLEACSACARLTKERNAILKSSNVNKTHLGIVTNQLIEASYEVCVKRKEFIAKLEPLMNKTLKAISNSIERVVSIKYSPFVEFDNKEEYFTKAKNAFKETLENDLRQKVTTIGVHREDFSVFLNGGLIDVYGSQGEKRMCAIALKLAPYFLVDDKEKRPIIVLDDVLSELDNKHQERLLAFLEKFNQVFITGTETEIECNASLYEVTNQNILRRNTHGK